MTGACHLLLPASVFIDDRLLVQNSFLSIAGAKVRKSAVGSNTFPAT